MRNGHWIIISNSTSDDLHWMETEQTEIPVLRDISAMIETSSRRSKKKEPVTSDHFKQEEDLFII